MHVACLLLYILNRCDLHSSLDDLERLHKCTRNKSAQGALHEAHIAVIRPVGFDLEQGHHILLLLNVLQVVLDVVQLLVLIPLRVG